MLSASLTAVAKEGRRDPGLRFVGFSAKNKPGHENRVYEILSGETDTIRHEHLRVETQIVSY